MDALGGSFSIRERLLADRAALLDLSTRNRLLNTPLRTRNNRAIEIVDEKATEIFRLLSEGKSLTFLSGSQLGEEDRAGLDPDDTETGGIPQPTESDHLDERGVASRHTDLRLQTKLTSEGLQKRLFDIWYDARTLEEEQGVNILYLAMGLLRWFENGDVDQPRHAPLVLLPVALERASAADKFRLKGRGEPPSPNLTLQAKMKGDFSILIEDFAEEDEVDLESYFRKLAEVISKQPKWEVLADSMVLGFFSFAKFLMYRDLDPALWPQGTSLDAHPLIAALLRDGFPALEPLVPEGQSVDNVIPAIDMNHVVDADSSQSVAIAEAANGRTLVVKGPPGTGKSQTITNIIAAAAARGRKVLFVAEKMAALEVVHRRLRHAGLGPLILELHSNKANKRSLLEDLRQTKDGVVRPSQSDVSIIEQLEESRELLNRFAWKFHQALEPCGLTPHQILGKLVKARRTEVDGGHSLEGAESWRPVDVEYRRGLVQDFANRLSTLGSPANHPWRGVEQEALDPAELDEIRKTIKSLEVALAAAIELAQMAESELGSPSARTIAGLNLAAECLDTVASAPSDFDRSALCHHAWVANLESLRRLVEKGQELNERRKEVSQTFNEAGRGVAYEAIRSALVTKGGSLFRWFDSNYRAQVRQLSSYLKVPLPKRKEDRLALVDQAIAARNAQASFQKAASLGEAFGRMWQGEDSDWQLLKEAVSWRECHAAVHEGFWRRLSDLSNPAPLLDARDELRKHLADLKSHLQFLKTSLRLDLGTAFGISSWREVPLVAIQERLAAWTDYFESVTRFIAFASRGRNLAEQGASSLVAAVHQGNLGEAELVPAFDRAYSETLRKVLFQSWPELRAFDGEAHERQVAIFRQLDMARIELAKEQIVGKHAEGRPRGNAGVGALGVLNGELAKKRRHLPIRQLLEKAGPAIQQLKPVFMMSPLSVAQYLKPGGMSFDLLVMDEASQIEPVDALGAIARARQLVVVGDERQLPPTSFFKKLTAEEDPEEDGDAPSLRASDAESILDLCLAKGVPHRLLSWHYRSKHQSLIAVSNREFYGNRLFIVPSPYSAVAGMGLKFNLLKDAPYDRGGTRTNPTEAKKIAEVVIQHARQSPDLSLGVATFSVAQRQAVLKELELGRRANPDIEGFFSSVGPEPFFVKNLENIQGDERDVILISVGYGKNGEGYLAHSFGPLSGEGGERRLNVLISRAKVRCEVFCNFSGAELDPDRSRSRGVLALKLFLTFAETGNFDSTNSGEGSRESELEGQVFEALRDRGYEVKPRIGSSDFRVDLAVADPENPGRFILGIECDGPSYNSSRSARDRDRLRQQVLEAHGWIIHRIWSTDWYLRPLEEIRKVEAAIEAARSDWRERDEGEPLQGRAVPLVFEAEQLGAFEIVTAIVEPLGRIQLPPALAPYREADFVIINALEPHEVPLAEMLNYVVRIVEIEGPIHVDEITTRIRSLWGLRRAGSRIRLAVATAASAATRKGAIVGGPFYVLPGQLIVPRSRASVLSAGLRKPEMLPPEEVSAALLKVVDDNFGARPEELIQASARLFGFAATSSQLRGALEDGLAALLENGSLKERDELLVRGQAPLSVHEPSSGA